jgi:hypothetical protein
VRRTPQPDGSGGLEKAAVSPDNRFIAYGDVPDLRLVSFDGSKSSVLVTGPYDRGCCSWSYGHPAFGADSSTVYYSTIGRLESIRVDGTGRQLLEEDQFFSNPTIDSFVFPNPSLSPDYTAMVAQVGCDVSELRIFPVGSLPADPCATGTKLATVHTSSADNEASNASWGPAGLIVYEDGIDFYVIPASGGTPQNISAAITTNGYMAADPVWASGCAAIP